MYVGTSLFIKLLEIEIDTFLLIMLFGDVLMFHKSLWITLVKGIVWSFGAYS